MTGRGRSATGAPGQEGARSLTWWHQALPARRERVGLRGVSVAAQVWRKAGPSPGASRLPLPLRRRGALDRGGLEPSPAAQERGFDRGGLEPSPAKRERGFRRGYLASSRSEEHTSELQSLMRISYAVFCLKKNKQHNIEQYRDRSS